MNIDDIKRQIIKVVAKTDNESLLNILQEDIAEYSVAPKDKMGEILGAVNWDELEEQAAEQTTGENSISEKEFNKWLSHWK